MLKLLIGGKDDEYKLSHVTKKLMTTAPATTKDLDYRTEKL